MRVGENFCPGVLHAVPARDGLLVRIRIPGGLIEPAQLRAVAELALRYADGTIEITSRANLQLRAIEQRNVAALGAGIAAAGLLPSALHDRVRNIVSSPLAGLDPEEVIDPRPLVRELDRRLRAETIFAELHPKFSFAVLGGRRRFSHEADDLSLEAASSEHLRLFVGGVATGFAVKREDAVCCLLEAAKRCLALAQEACIPARARRVIALPAAMERMVDALAPWLLASSPEAVPSAVEEAPVGVSPTTQFGCVAIVPSIPLGRVSARQAQELADAAAAGDLRMAPWRGVVLGAIPHAEVDRIVSRLEFVGLRCDGRDGFRGISACAGITGCDASLADVRADAVLLAQRLAGLDAPAGWTVNFSGCEKQCARRHAATAELVADGVGYRLKIAGQVSRGSAESALEAVTGLFAEVATR